MAWVASGTRTGPDPGCTGSGGLALPPFFTGKLSKALGGSVPVFPSLACICDFVVLELAFFFKPL